MLYVDSTDLLYIHTTDDELYALNLHNGLSVKMKTRKQMSAMVYILTPIDKTCFHDGTRHIFTAEKSVEDEFYTIYRLDFTWRNPSPWVVPTHETIIGMYFYVDFPKKSYCIFLEKSFEGVNF